MNLKNLINKELYTSKHISPTRRELIINNTILTQILYKLINKINDNEEAIKELNTKVSHITSTVTIDKEEQYKIK